MGMNCQFLHNIYVLHVHNVVAAAMRKCTEIFVSVWKSLVTSTYKIGFNHAIIMLLFFFFLWCLCGIFVIYDTVYLYIDSIITSYK